MDPLWTKNPEKNAHGHFISQGEIPGKRVVTETEGNNIQMGLYSLHPSVILWWSSYPY
jgi:hypothetical protein